MKLIQYLSNVNNKINEYAKRYSQPYNTFAIFGLITYPLYYLIWRITDAKSYDSLTLRIISILLCLGLALKKYWPKELQKFIPIYWYLTLLICLPYYFTILLFKNNLSYNWSMNAMTIIVLCFLLLEPIPLAIILFLGISLGLLTFILMGGEFYFQSQQMFLLITYSSVLLFGGLFSYRKDQLRAAEEQLKRNEAKRLKLKNKAQLIQLKTQETFNTIAAQVAHDIRSPLSTLLMIVKNCTQIPERERISLREAAVNIGDIAYHLLNQYQFNHAGELIPSAEESQPLFVSAALLQILSDKKYQYHSKGIKFENKFNEASQFAFIKICPSDFNRMISNLINNAVDSIEGDNGCITLYLSASNEWVKISVSDNGKGMNAKLLKTIESKIAVSSGKDRGHGIGLTQVRSALEKSLGEMSIQSTLGKGSSITLTFPRITTPHWIADVIKVNAEGFIIILDDDTSIHRAWDLRFTHTLEKFPSIEIKHFINGYKALEFIQTLSLSLKNKCLLLTDYELLNQKMNGLKIIQKARIPHSILVTSHYADGEIKDAAARLSCKILPKQLASEIPILVNESAKTLQNPDLILIEDNENFAKTLINFVFCDKNVAYFTKPEDLAPKLDTYPKKTPIYLDNQFNSGITGLEFAKKLYKHGFTNLNLLTAEKLDQRLIPSYLKVINKTDFV
ncbi:MAG: hypothetical protein A3F18_04065 [Legionellales bacterium RIFCSPHIGHO2_12_FULL_37_14]|nr:MAG: hypothetical protein A3F18_04065 [Legionellales bacterium RIFCSPHIGHO2_12_FULL_37_14]